MKPIHVLSPIFVLLGVGFSGGEFVFVVVVDCWVWSDEMFIWLKWTPFF